MPIHEYKCSDCGALNELLVGIGRNSDDLTCRSCGGTRLERLMSASSISIRSESEISPVGTTCCGSNPSDKGCVPGSCCGST
ncbi:MAG: zinc ribbon domain-containing protein [Deltaproteobacteria bacterium]